MLSNPKSDHLTQMLHSNVCQPKPELYSLIWYPLTILRKYIFTHMKTWVLDMKVAALNQVQVLFVFDEPEFDKQMSLEHLTAPKMYQLEKISNRTLNLIKYR